MNITIEKASLGGAVRAIPSKSYAHRMLICAALSDKSCTIECPEVSADIIATAGCMGGLCAEILRMDTGYKVNPVVPKARAEIDCGESGSTYRFILPVACAMGVETTFLLHGRLSERPMQPLYEALEAHGIAIDGKGSAAVTASGKLTAGDYHIPADISSQFISGLLFALPLLNGDSRIVLSGKLASAAYIDITRDVLADFGIVTEETDYGYFVRGGQKYRAKDGLSVEGDWSNAAFWLAAGALGNQEITCCALNHSSVQGDKEVIEILERFGADVRRTENSVTVCGGKLKGISVDAENIPDLVPVLSAVACAAEGETVFYNASRLREKESDRIYSTAQTLRAMGADITETDDGLIVRKSVLRGAEVDSFGDHRIAMMAAVAAVYAKEPVMIREAQAVEKSYPAFFRDYAALGGMIKEH